MGKNENFIKGSNNEKNACSIDNKSKRITQNSTKGFILLEKFRKKVISRGLNGIFGIQRLFKAIDEDNSMSLSLEEFKKACRDYRLEFEDYEIKILFEIFDIDKNGVIDINEFIQIIIGEMSGFRKKFVKMAFNKLDVYKKGILNLNQIRSKN